MKMKRVPLRVYDEVNASIVFKHNQQKQVYCDKDSRDSFYDI